LEAISSFNGYTAIIILTTPSDWRLPTKVKNKMTGRAAA